MIKIDGKEFEYVEGLTVSGAYRLACGDSKLEHIASLNGTLVLRSLWDETVIPDGSDMVFIPIASGG
ncbi:MAG: MoaD/ThiS family protein [Lachnospiraceae bacterium]|nr:MoaD/ThiS family protein [Lachnospiraceae bacterium]